MFLCSFQDCIQLNQYKLKTEIGKVINHPHAEVNHEGRCINLVSSLQGSYGVVKLAWNEDSEQYYVSLSFKKDFPVKINHLDYLFDRFRR